jgi:hypothetical protein
MLEVIDKGQPSEKHRHPLLFVHGAFHRGWCWDVPHRRTTTAKAQTSRFRMPTFSLRTPAPKAKCADEHDEHAAGNTNRGGRPCQRI